MMPLRRLARLLAHGRHTVSATVYPSVPWLSHDRGLNGASKLPLQSSWHWCSLWARTDGVLLGQGTSPSLLSAGMGAGESTPCI